MELMAALRAVARGRRSTSFRVSRRESTSMADNKPYRNRVELLQGTLDMLILQTLQWGPQHGHGIGQAIRATSGELLQIETGSLYPALHRLQKHGWLASKWKISENNQRAKYYSLTAAGKKQLASEQSRWKLLVRAISGVLKPAQ
jgi:PadR family transcriptional regulator PadR